MLCFVSRNQSHQDIKLIAFWGVFFCVHEGINALKRCVVIFLSLNRSNVHDIGPFLGIRLSAGQTWVTSILSYALCVPIQRI